MKIAVKLAFDERAALLHKVADEITRRFADFVAAEMADTGQPKSMMEHAFIPRGAANFKIFADVVKNVATESFMTPTPDGAGALNYAIRVPKGVIGVICPWNAPLLLMTWKVGPALACGNTVVVKPSEETPATATLLGEVMSKVGIDLLDALGDQLIYIGLCGQIGVAAVGDIAAFSPVADGFHVDADKRIASITAITKGNGFLDEGEELEFVFDVLRREHLALRHLANVLDRKSVV